MSALAARVQDVYSRMEAETACVITRSWLEDNGLGDVQLLTVAHSIPAPHFPAEVWVDYTTDNIIISRGDWPDNLPKPGKLARKYL